MSSRLGGVKLFVAGDLLVQHPCTYYDDPQVAALRDMVRAADVSMANLEVVITDGDEPPAFIAGQGGFGSPYMAVGPWIVNELEAFGFDLLFTANNHASDFGEAGIMSTLRHLDGAGLHHAGSGRNLTEASAATYVTTGHGRVAVINSADNGIRARGEVPFPVPRGCMAADQGPWFADRPGLNMIRYEPIYHVDAGTFDALRRASAELGWDEDKRLRAQGGGLHSPSMGASALDTRQDTDALCHFLGSKFALDDHFSFETVAFEEDLQRNEQWVREARRHADIVVVGMHQQGASWNEDDPPDHTRALAHRSIDAGADVFVAHGHGRAGGVELYQGKPIVYGMPTFVNQLLQRTRVPAEQLQRFGFAPSTPAGELMERLDRGMHAGLYAAGFGSANPTQGMAVVELEFDRDHRFTRLVVSAVEPVGDSRTGGWPALAERGSPASKQVLDLIAERSAQYGTDVQLADGTAVVQASAGDGR